MPKKIAVIDGNSLMYRAYHAVPPTMNAPDGTPTNAVFGFIAMFLKLYEMAKPDAVICAFDAGKPEFRMKALETYKAQRPPMDDELRVQFPVIESLLEAMSVPVVRLKGWEGDDILGTIAARDEELGYETLLITGDKDAYQLVTDLTRVVTTKKGITDVAIYGPAEVEERYGVTPEQFPDFLGLKGDSADNIPGVPGIGDKTAAKLLQNYGTMDGIYENLDKLKGKQLENLTNNRDVAFISREVATIVRDVDLEVDLEAAAFPAFDAQAVTDAFHAVRFNSHLQKVQGLAGQEAPVTAAAAIELPKADVLTGAEAAEGLAAAIDAGQMIALEFVVSDQASLFDDFKTMFAGTAEAVFKFTDEEVAPAFARVVREARFCALDVKKTLQEGYPADTAKDAELTADDVRHADYFDIGLAAYLLNSNTDAFAYDALADTYLASSLPETKDDDAAAAVHVLVAPRLVDALREALDKDGSADVYYKIDLPLVSTLTLMERVGAQLDVDALAAMGSATRGEIDSLRAHIHELAGEEFNVDSPKQLGVILFDKLGLPHGKKTRTGYSTNAATLKKLQSIHPIADEVLRYRELAKMSSTYIDALPRMRADDGRVHTHFNQTVTTTGRLSSSDPNLQNIPVRTDFGRRIRECFVPLREGDVFVSADYSQIELRLLAHLSGDEHLVDAFCSGADFHAATAARVFDVPVDEVTPQLRSRAKAVNFGIVYGQQAFGLAQSLDIGFKEAQDMIDRYFEAYPGVRSYLDKTVEDAKQTGYAVTMFGRKRHIPELKMRNAVQRGFGERTAMNHPMQGSAADIIKLAMNEVQRRLIEDGFESQLMLQVHDELDLSVPADELERLSDMVREVMSTIVELKVPLLVDVSSGPNWAAAH
ncbi:DNA polymerase I [Slackia heliotrinireducens]|uniref:DNA polymerase I n=1 Tax=Slackia heliotrinireducens TaxID=84110 RepID=UPI0033149791